MSNFLLEIGTEELPAGFAQLAVSQMQDLVSRDLGDHRLRFDEIICSSTPRRIFLIIKALAGSSDDLIEERKGPSLSNAFDNNCATKAAIGFAKSCGVAVDDLETKVTPKGSFVFARVVKKGQNTSDLINTLISGWINGLQGKRFMRWSIGEMRFSRPIRWVVSLLDDKEISFVLSQVDPEIHSGRLSKGHRLCKGFVSISSSDQYIDSMREAGVIVIREERSNLIKSLVKESSISLDSRADLTTELLDELTDLVESPSLIVGKFSDSFLELPSEVLSTVMQVHQRYVPLYKKDAVFDPLALDSKSTLTSNFLCICNSLPSSNATVRDGNERVLKARFSDAKFFVNADLSVSSDSRRNELKKVIFADGLGTLFDRVNRIEWLTEHFLKYFKNSKINNDHLRRAARFSKHDLVSYMVGEFPELQGIMGAKYLIAEGEPRDVGLAVLEQYLPRGHGGELPSSEIGSALALIERIELLLSIFSKGERPSGSSDPYALRRAGNGILQIIWNQDWNLNLYEFLGESTSYWINLFPDFKSNTSNLYEDLIKFFHSRILSLLEELKVDVDIIQAVAGETISSIRLLSNPTDVIKRIDLLMEMRASNKLASIHAVVNRASKLADKSNLPSSVLSTAEVVDISLFEKDSEKLMKEVIDSLTPIAQSTSLDRYKQLSDGLVAGSAALAEFFDGENSVMVMTENEEIRVNRLHLLSVLRNQAYLIADFSRINC